MSRTAGNWIGLLGYAAAAILLTLFDNGGGVLAGIAIMIANILFHLTVNRCPHCGKFQGFIVFPRQCKRCGEEL